MLIACVDDSLGMMFHNRRVSRDKAVIADIVKMCGQSCLHIEEYSRKLFEPETLGKCVPVKESEVNVSAGETENNVSAKKSEVNVSVEKLYDNEHLDHFDGEYFFLENAQSIQNVMKQENGIEKLVLYYWNRKYPADQYFPIDLTEWSEESREEFPGNSHEKITKVTYVKKQ